MSDRQKIDAAVVIEFRSKQWTVDYPEGTDIVRAMTSFLANLPPTTPILFYHRAENRDFVYNSFEDHIMSGKIRPIQVATSEASNHTFIWEYSRFLTRLDFWESLPGENILMFQDDSCLCGPNIFKLDSILQYDYVGGTWTKGVYRKHDDLFRGKRLGGNGGLSFRKKSAMIKLLRNKHLHPRSCPSDVGGEPINEDLWFCTHPMFSELNLPSYEESKQYFNEYELTENPLGVHNVWTYHQSPSLEHLARTGCPELASHLPHIVRHHMWVRYRQYYNP
jgi:hypothetical protein